MRERAAALKHDLGKYVAWRSINLSEDVWTGPVTDELVDALRADLLETRSTGEHSECAWEVWARLTADLPRPLEEPELARVERAVEALRAFERALRGGDPQGIEAGRLSVRRAQLEIREGLRDFHRRMMRSQAEG
jgi:hypothetical protein